MSNRVFVTQKDIDLALVASDPAFKPLVEFCSPIERAMSTDHFTALAKSIVFQQVSTRVAEVIWQRVLALLGDEVTATSILAREHLQFRELGVSNAKIDYLKNLSRAVISQEIALDRIDEMTDEEVIAQLTAIKGIGQWTAEMFLIFSLGREDVFSAGDGALQRAVQWLYNLDAPPTRKQLLALSERWRPYRTYASLYLWQSIRHKDEFSPRDTNDRENRID